MRRVLQIVERNKAGQGIRFLNYAIDNLVIYVFFFVLGIVAVLMDEYLDISFLLSIVDTMSEVNRFEDMLITSFIYFLYVFLMEYFTNGRTIGKYITGDPYNSDPVRHYALNHKNGKIMFQVWSNSASGEVGVLELEGFKQTIKAPTASEMQKEIEANGKAILNINFDTDKATLKADGLKIVDEIALLLNNNSNLKLSIEGHTDNTGSVTRNKQLSGERANTVMYALAGKGIDINRLKASGFGSEKPLATNDSDGNKAKNRRVELVKF